MIGSSCSCSLCRAVRTRTRRGHPPDIKPTTPDHAPRRRAGAQVLGGGGDSASPRPPGRTDRQTLHGFGAAGGHAAVHERSSGASRAWSRTRPDISSLGVLLRTSRHPSRGRCAGGLDEMRLSSARSSRERARGWWPWAKSTTVLADRGRPASAGSHAGGSADRENVVEKDRGGGTDGQRLRRRRDRPWPRAGERPPSAWYGSASSPAAPGGPDTPRLSPGPRRGHGPQPRQSILATRASARPPPPRGPAPTPRARKAVD